jgi:hypothetical protein
MVAIAAWQPREGAGRVASSPGALALNGAAEAGRLWGSVDVAGPSG